MLKETLCRTLLNCRESRPTLLDRFFSEIDYFVYFLQLRVICSLLVRTRLLTVGRYTIPIKFCHLSWKKVCVFTPYLQSFISATCRCGNPDPWKPLSTDLTPNQDTTDSMYSPYPVTFLRSKTSQSTQTVKSRQERWKVAHWTRSINPRTSDYKSDLRVDILLLYFVWNTIPNLISSIDTFVDGSTDCVPSMDSLQSGGRGRQTKRPLLPYHHHDLFTLVPEYIILKIIRTLVLNLLWRFTGRSLILTKSYPFPFLKVSFLDEVLFFYIYLSIDPELWPSSLTWNIPYYN